MGMCLHTTVVWWESYAETGWEPILPLSEWFSHGKFLSLSLRSFISNIGASYLAWLL